MSIRRAAAGTPASVPFRVCDLTTLYIDGGAGGVNTYLREKARFFSGLDGSVEHHAIVPGERNGRQRLFGSTVHLIKSPRLPGDRQHRVLINLPAAGRILRRVSPDVVEVDAAYIFGYLARAALPRRRPAVVGFYHAHLPFYAARLGAHRGSGALRWPGRVGERLAWRYLSFCSRPFDRLVVPSLDMAERLRGAGFDRLEHVPLGVNLDLFRPSTRAAVEGRRTVLYVGRLSGEKDLEVLFEAYRILADRAKGLRLVVVGDGPLLPLAKSFAEGRGDVVVRGLCPYGPELARIYGEADVLAVPGRNETFGLTILEALASGLPVVASRRGGPVELIGPEVGELARPGDAGDLAEKLGLVLERGRDPRRLRRHAEGQYSWDRTFRRLLSIYAGLRRPAREAAAARREAAPADWEEAAPSLVVVHERRTGGSEVLKLPHRARGER